MECPRCKREVSGNQPLCGYCGAPIQATLTCPKCTHQLPLHLSFCSYCGASLRSARAATGAATPAPPAEPPPVDPDLLRTNAAARLMWGDAPDYVRAELIREGHSPGLVEAAVREGLRKRQVAFRQMGLRDVVAGFLLAPLAVVAFVIYFATVDTGLTILQPWLLVPLAALGFLFLSGYFLVRGFKRLALKGSDERSGIDVEDD